MWIDQPDTENADSLNWCTTQTGATWTLDGHGILLLYTSTRVLQ